MNPTRDIQLDIYRALAMIYIPCVIHAAYWLHPLSEPLLSIILFEMPVVFFISGASLSGRPSKNFKDTFVSRFKRVLLPYYIYFTIYLVFVAVAAYLDPNLGFTTDIFKGYIIPKDCGYLYCWHLWFIIPYLIISISFPLQCDIINRLRWKYLLLNLILMGIAMALQANIIIREIVCFNIFFVTGYLYYRKLSVRQLALIACCGIIAILGVLMLTETSFTQNTYSDSFGYGEPLQYFLTIPLTLLFIILPLDKINATICNLFKYIAHYTLGIYCVHLFYLLETAAILY